MSNRIMTKSRPPAEPTAGLKPQEDQTMKMATNTPTAAPEALLALANRLENAAQRASTEAERSDLLRRAKQARTDARTRREAKERAHLLDDLLYAKSQGRPVGWSSSELQAMPIVELRRAFDTTFPERAQGRRDATLSDFDFVRPIMTGRRGESVLDGPDAA